MNKPDFPDRALRPEPTTLPATIENVDRLLTHAGIRCRYNEVKKRIEIDLPGHAGTDDNRDNVTLTHVRSLAARHGMPVGMVPECVDAIADRNAYNPAADWIRGAAWDGRDRMAAFCATVTPRDDYPKHLRDALVTKWTRSAAAAALVPEYRGRGVLTLQGEQGLGKTSWVKALVTDPTLRDSVVKLDHHLDAGNKDSVLGAISNWIVEVGELDSSLKRDVARLKGFLTADSDRVRRPYDRRESEYRRRTVFVATVNDDRFLVDTTGNSRWWTVPVAALDYAHGIDMQQVFAQAAHQVLEGGEPWWLDPDEERLLEACNGRHMAVSAVGEALAGWLDLDRAGDFNLPALTATEVLEVLGWKQPSNPQAKKCAAALRAALGSSRRIRGADRWRVPLREPSGAELRLDVAERGAAPVSITDGEVF